MSTSRHIDKICIAAISITLVITILFMFGGNFGLVAVASSPKYESTLFDTSYVHTIDIVMNDWDTFIENCESEEYSVCTVVVDGSKYSNIAIRAKGNTSLSNVSSLGSQRYSFKLEFDHYEDGKTLDGLDKLCLNNLIQDNTMMKDYLSYTLMGDFGVESPLCSYAYLTVNGEDWGLYLAVEGIEDSFLSRNYGSESGDLYKPDSMSFGGGRGNGKGFNMDDFDFDFDESDIEDFKNRGGFNRDGEKSDETSSVPDTEPSETTSAQTSEPEETTDGGNFTPPSGDGGNFTPPSGDGGNFTPPSGDGGNFTPPTVNTGSSSGSNIASLSAGGAMPTPPSGNFNAEDFDFGNFNPSDFDAGDFDPSSIGGGNGIGGGMGGGMGSDDVKLKYIDDDPDSYSNIFDNAKTNVTEADQKRLIASLKSLSSYTDLENILDTDEVLRYFVVHNFLCNGDSYTGSMIHNYYLHENDGKLSMIPWDYNLAFGTFQGGNGSSSVNASIDSPISGGDSDDRPMLGWIFSDESYTAEYHELFGEFIDRWFSNGELEKLISDTADMIRPYVEKDPTKFCTSEEFEAGVTAISQFTSLRAEAVSNQLAGDNTAVSTDSLNISDMGTMGGSMGGNNGGGMGGGNEQGGNFSVSSLITVKDKDGNEVDIASLIGDVSNIASIALSDGTVIDTAESDMRSLMQTDLTKITSVTDKDGNVTDLSDYTISVNDFGGRDSGNAGAPVQPGEDGENGGGMTPPSGDTDGENGGGMTPPSGDTDGENGGGMTPPSGDTDSENGGGMTPPSGDTDSENGGGMTPPSGNFSPDSMPSGSTGSANVYILLGVSVLVLILGLIIAIRKK